MNGKNISARRTGAVLLSLAVAPIVVWGLVFNGGARANSGPAGGRVDLMDTQQRLSAPLKPEWVEELLDARATALRELLEASDLQAAWQGAQATRARVPGSAPLKPEWVEALLDARATARQAFLEAHDLVAARQRPDLRPAPAGSYARPIAAP